jgi:hypothetical protein
MPAWCSWYGPRTVGWVPVLGELCVCVCVLEHCSTQLLNSELQQTITQAMWLVPKVTIVQSFVWEWDGKEAYTNSWFSHVLLSLCSSVRLPGSSTQSEQNVCNLSVSCGLCRRKCSCCKFSAFNLPWPSELYRIHLFFYIRTILASETRQTSSSLW